MSTLSLVYKGKEKNGTGITVKKTYMVPIDELYLEEGFNIRPLDMEHAEYMRDCWIAGADLPPLSVIVTEQGIKVLDGQHRFIGAKLAAEMGYPIPRIECKDFVGTPLQALAHQAKSSQGKPISAIERALGYVRAKNQGYSLTEIAKEFGRSITDVETHLQLLSSGQELISMVESGEVAPTTAVALSREHGASAGRIATQQLEKAKASGKKKLTRSAAMPQFSAAKARRLVELLCDARYMGVVDGEAVLYHDDKYTAEVISILNEYRDANEQNGEGE
ncbi:ParB/RepB/Spo0J family partition protein [Pantoea cypripedii]|uniref:DNA-binding protein n=1 Tax=Pantoea cypripedii TaxID=55209 RepID=A0A1X1ESY5_PANCY|nr:ParB/RepB/Spo0J family partition protein [Pantoea cypripedii]MBP2197198.1 ParB-like chromosome segregation protein Spo0J [Pantoea cypripedii]ORM93128.1 DNA-binding protein [Pantoea cypripedii]